MEDKDRVRQAADILDVIGTATVLKHKGGPWYQGLCPFHTEKTASFRVNSDEGIYRCFGCGAKGDVFNFVIQRESTDFRGALRILAERCGITLSEENPEFVDEQRRMREAMIEAQKYFRHTFDHSDEGEEARAYAAKRGLTSDTIERFGIGAASRNWEGLFRHLTRAGYSPETLDTAGLCRPNQSGGHRDYFRNRLMFPICSDMGTVVAFGGRTLDASDQVKYLNSPDTPIYQKGHQVFGLHLAKEAIRQADRVLIVEGYMDVVAVHQAGFRETVAVLGTAMTPQQAKSILRFTASRRVVVGFDADRAGQEAANRGISTLEEVARSAGIHLSVLCVPDGKDPDEYIKVHGAEAFSLLIDHAPDSFAFQIDRALGAIPDVKSSAGLAEAIRRLGPMFRRLDSPVQAEPYYHKVAAALGRDASVVAMDFNRHLRHNGALRTGSRPVPVAQQRVAEAERGLIYLMVTDAEVRRTVADRLVDIPFPTPECQALRERLSADLADLRAWPELLDACVGTPQHDFLIDLRFEDFGQRLPSDSQRAADDFVDALAYEHWKGVASSRQQDLRRPDLPPDEFMRITQDFIDAQVRAREHLARLSGREP